MCVSVCGSVAALLMSVFAWVGGRGEGPSQIPGSPGESRVALQRFHLANNTLSHTHTHTHPTQAFPVPSAWISLDPVNSLLILFSHSEAAGSSRICNRKLLKLQLVSNNILFQSQRDAKEALKAPGPGPRAPGPRPQALGPRPQASGPGSQALGPQP